ncbi:angiogenin-like [Rhinatrema bivittatum]|uniref:angiogenin-like n=1 Tax=Rhinatrema bivittatum TaxID=194408 RepID=UPI00112E5822|nr:angiogenin-like [Rhinatrema bivittatum]
MRGFLLSPLASLLLLFLLTLISPATSQNYREFKRKHLDSRTTAQWWDGNYCSALIKERNIRGPWGRCKPVNVFIHGKEQAMQILCPSRENKTRISRESYPLTKCQHQAEWPRSHFHCNYRAKSGVRKIKIQCTAGRPVHFIQDMEGW